MTVNHPDYNSGIAIPHIVGFYTESSYILRCECCQYPLCSYSNEQAAEKSVSWYEQQGHTGVYIDQKSTTLSIIEDY